MDGATVNVAPQEILDLVARYNRETQVLQSDAYGEADTRKEFIEPLFTALGWDVANVAKHAEAYKDVVNEFSLKVGVSHSAPDYAFRLGGTRKFFVEAKRPGVDISKDRTSAYQLRRYGWTGKLPVSVLANFRHIAIYDCARRPSETDNAATARTLIVPWQDLATRWSELEELLGKNAVYQGSLDRYAAKATRRRGTSPVDEAFLVQMEEWRTALARNIALRNQSLNVGELNEAVQQTLDRLVFLRIAEDRGIEPYETLKRTLKGDGVYGRLMDAFQAADARYNSGLFHFRKQRDVSGAPDLLTPSLAIDDKILRGVVGAMYYPISPYEFSVLPADILGQVYERFLGKVIRLTANHTARVEEKPEMRRAGGVYYTPTRIVNHIVETTLGRELIDKTPRSALNLRIVDPACGSGSFLIGVYDYLLRWFALAYEAGNESTRKRTMYLDHAGEWRLTLGERKRILTSCIFGVDIDRQAVEVTKLSLMLKVLEGESSETMNSQLEMFHLERALPDLNRNIQCGNSLMGSDVHDFLILSPDEDDAVNAFDWGVGFPEIVKSGGFHVVLGNPPYDVLEKERGAASWPHAILRDYLPYRPDYEPALGGKLNLYRLFLVRSLGLVRPGGRFGMIVPLGLAADISTTPTRRHMLSWLKEPSLDCFPQKDNPARRIFKDAKLPTLVICGMKSSRDAGGRNRITTRVFPGNDLSEASIDNTLTLADLTLLDPITPVALMDKEEWSLCRRLHAHPSVVRLAELTDSYVVTRGEINQTTYRGYIKEVQAGCEPLLRGVEVGAFGLRSSLSQGRRECIDAVALLADFPKKSKPVAERLATQRITGVDERQRLVAAVVSKPYWFADSTNSIAPVPGAVLSLDYLAALLNSDLMQWRFRLTSTNNNVGTNELLSMPIRAMDLSVPNQKDLYDAVCKAGQKVADVQAAVMRSRSSAQTDQLQRRLDAAWSSLNSVVYDCYDILTEGRALIENRLAKTPVAALGIIAD